MQKEDGVRAGLVTEVPFEVRFSIGNVISVSGFALLAYSLGSFLLKNGQSDLVQANLRRRSPHASQHAQPLSSVWSEHRSGRERSFSPYRGTLAPPLGRPQPKPPRHRQPTPHRPPARPRIHLKELCVKEEGQHTYTHTHSPRQLCLGPQPNPSR